MPKKPKLEITLEDLSIAKNTTPKEILRKKVIGKDSATIRTFRLPDKQYSFLMKQAGKKMSKGEKSNPTMILISLINKAMQ